MLSEKSENFDKKSNPYQSKPNQSKPNQSNRNFLKSPRAPWSYFCVFVLVCLDHNNISRTVTSKQLVVIAEEASMPLITAAQ